MVILNTRPIRTNMDKIFNFCSCDCIKVDFRRYFMVWICINTQKFFLHWMQTFKLHVHVQRIKLFIIFKIMINFFVFCNLIFKARSSVFERGGSRFVQPPTQYFICRFKKNICSEKKGGGAVTVDPPSPWCYMPGFLYMYLMVLNWK